MSTSKFRIVVIVMLLCLFSFTITSYAANGRRGTGRGYFMVGYSQLNFDELNNCLTAKGYPELSNSLITLGGGGHAIINKFVIGGQGNAYLGSKEEAKIGDDRYETSIAAAAGFFNIGYLLYSKNGLCIYPLLGFGGGGMTMKIVDQTSPSFDEVLDNPKRNTSLTTGGFLLDVSVGMDYLIKMEEDENGYGGLVIGLRAGYTIALNKGDWILETIEISGGPDIGITGPYVRLLFGGGGTSNY